MAPRTSPDVLPNVIPPLRYGVGALWPRALQRQSEWHGARETPGISGPGPGSDYRRLSELTLGVLGLGDIGTEIARTLGPNGLRMHVVGCRRDPSPRPSDAAAGVGHVFGLKDISTFLASSDYVVSVRSARYR